MADTNAILQSDKSAAPSVALLILCALVAFELAVGVHTMLNKGSGGSVYSVKPEIKVVVPGQPASQAVGVTPFSVPPIPAFSTPLPSMGAVPPAPQFADPLALPSGSAPVPPVARRTVSNPVVAPLAPPAVAVTSPQAPKSPPGDALNASTGNAQADELLEVAKQSRELGDDDGALQVLLRADLLVPNNARVLHEKSLTMKKLGIPEEPKAPADAPPEPPPEGVIAPVASPSAPVPPSLNQSFGTKAAVASPPPPEPVAVPPAVTVRGALSLGQCKVERDPTVLRGERLFLKVPLEANSGEVIEPDHVQLDVFFYDKVNGERVELSMADKPTVGYDTAGDFKTGHEVVSVLYNLPEFSANEVSQLGRHAFYGYVVKLYYKNRLVGVTANPPELSTLGDSPTGKRN